MSTHIRNLSDLEEIDRFEDAIASFGRGEIDPDRFTAIRLQQGVYGQRQPEVNMLRIKVPGGRLTAQQLGVIGEVTAEFSQHRIAHLTTRQSIQIHYIPLARMPEAMRRLAAVGMTTREACGNTIRNMTACALAGVCPKERVDVNTHLQGATLHFLRNPLNQQLPRKFKIAFSGCEADCAQSLLHDCGVIATEINGRPGFRIRAGGGLGHKPREAIVVDEFVAESELLFAMEALVALHNKYSDRTKRAKSRIKFLVERFGAEGFIEKYREEFERTKQALAGQAHPQGVWHQPEASEAPGQGAPRRIFAQRQSGLNVFPIALPIPGFRIRAGGGLGHKPREAIVVDEFVAESELLFAMEALVALHNKYSDRTKRAKSRIKFLVERFGAEGFIEKYREEFERTKQALAGQAHPQGVWHQPEASEAPGQGAPRRIFAQRQSGLNVFPIALPIGDVSAEQLSGISVLLQELALAEVHTTQDQNLAVFNVPQHKLATLRGGLALLGLAEPQRGDNVVACPGTSTCRLGITSSTVVAPMLSGGSADLHIRVSGCHNGCAQPETGDIGIYGEAKRLHGKLVPHYQMYFAGKGSADGALALKGPTLPAARIKQAIERVQQAHLKSGESSFFVWARQQAPEYFRDLLADLAEVSPAQLQSVMHDFGDKTDFRVLNLGGGECAGASQVLIGANFFEAAHEREYRNALVFQRKYSEAAQCNESILKLLGSGVAQLLGGKRQDDLQLLAQELNLLAPEEIAIEFTHAALGAAAEETDIDAVASASAKVDAWTLKVAEFATQKDGQLDLKEALPK